MSDIAIRAEGLGKSYSIGAVRDTHQTLGDAVAAAARIPYRRLRKFVRREPPNPSTETIWAIKDASFDIRHGEAIGIIGHNGAGKSTLLKILSRITAPTKGYADVYGRVGSLLEVGTGFHPELTGRENIYLNGNILGLKKAQVDEKFDEIVAFSEVEKFIDTPVKHYSSGMHVRLAFAVAAHIEPEILLVDEVLAVGDAAFQKKCLGKMGDVAHEGRTVLFVSHNMAMIANLCPRAMLLQDGRIIETGPTNPIIDNYLKRIASSAHTALAARKDRQGSGQIIIKDIELYDAQESPIAYPISGQDLTIRLYYQSVVDKVFKNCRVSVLVSRNERPYFNLSTELVDTRQLDVKGSGFIDFIVPALPLSEGTYYLTVYLDSNGETQDWVLNAAEMSVVDGDFYGTGRNYPSSAWRGATVLVNFHWRLDDHRFAVDRAVV